jgi:hypothetical protein
MTNRKVPKRSSLGRVAQKYRRQSHPIDRAGKDVDGSSLKGTPSNPRLSIYRKYRRRLTRLRAAIEDFQTAAGDRLTDGGEIKNRNETKKIVKALERVARLLPRETEPELAQESGLLDRIFGI